MVVIVLGISMLAAARRYKFFNAPWFFTARKALRSSEDIGFRAEISRLRYSCSSLRARIFGSVEQLFEEGDRLRSSC